MTDTLPADPIAAASHPDPYPYYAELVARKPLHWHEGLRMWVAASAHRVTEVLNHAHGRVRPPDQVAPPALVGTDAGAAFTRMLRMNDGALHTQLRRCVGTALAALPAATMRHAIANCTSRLLQREALPASPSAVESVMRRLPAASVASLLGIADAQLDAAVSATGDWIAGIAPGAGGDAVLHAEGALERLQGLLGPGWPRAAAAPLARLLNGYVQGISAELILANAVGLMMQAHDATAALIGNTLVALAREPRALSAVRIDAGLWPSVLAEVARHDAPVQNTRRHAAATMMIGGEDISKGDTVLVVLAAAQRDPAVHAEPARFRVDRTERHLRCFGHGRHACPGENLANVIAEIGVRALLGAGLEPERLLPGMKYRPFSNIRMPWFASA